jgi:cellulose synthase/poly-beta-1,6-N-acetylglucosamine synthase-like glycosyltransferase
MFFLLFTILIFGGYAALILYYRTGWKGVEGQESGIRNWGKEEAEQQVAAVVNKERGAAVIGQSPIVPLETNAANDQPFISVIIPARNEAAHIGNCVQAVLQQSLPATDFEIIVVDDFSEDDTPRIVQGFAAPHLQLLPLADVLQTARGENAFKKRAIEAGVAVARGQLIVTTDADCIAPPHWLATIAAFYRQHRPVFIAAPVRISNGQSYVEIFQALDFMTLQGITGASVYLQFHTMCNGANLAYERAAFYAINGFAGIDNIASGDDMLLMHKMYARWPQRVLYLQARAAIVRTQPVHSWRDFFRQRIRWASKAGQYKDRRIFFALLLVYLFNCWLLLLAVAGIWLPHCWWLLGAALVAKTIVELWFLWPVANFFGQQSLLWWFPLSQPVHVLYTIIAGWLGQFGKYEWKGRKVR